MDPPTDPIKSDELEKISIGERLARTVKDLLNKIGFTAENFEKFKKRCNNRVTRGICKGLVMILTIIPNVLIAYLFFLLLQYQLSDAPAIPRYIAYSIHFCVVLIFFRILLCPMIACFEEIDCSVYLCLFCLPVSIVFLVACLIAPLLAYLYNHFSFSTCPNTFSPVTCTLSINGTDVDVFLGQGSQFVCDVLSRAVINETQLITALGYDF